MVDITKTITDCRDSKDSKFLELATSGHAQFILTNDKDLLVLNPYESISIVEPAYFLAMRLDRIEN